MAQIPYVLTVGSAQFVGTADTDGPSTHGKILIAGVPAGDYNLDRNNIEVITKTGVNKAGVHLHVDERNVVVLYALINPLNGAEINNFGGWHVVANW